MNYYYYSEDGKKFINRIEALQYNHDTGKNINFYYYDDVYDKLDWKKEPPFTLETLYKMQAQRIRDEYDYIVLCYSGGYDSTKILENFHYNNIKLDKIIVTGPFSRDANSGSDINHNGEIYENAFPYLDYLGLSSITQKIDYTHLYDNDKIEQLSIYGAGDEWVNILGGVRFSPHNFFWKDLHKYVIPPNFDDKKVAIIWGTEKSFISKKDGIKGFNFIDNPILSYSRHDVNKITNIDNINFYWDQNFPLIVLKQLHVLKNLGYIYIGPSQYVDAIYNLKKPLKYKSPKSPNLFIGKRDMFLFQTDATRLIDFYNMGINKVKHLFDTDLSKAIKTKFYAIE